MHECVQCGGAMALAVRPGMSVCSHACVEASGGVLPRPWRRSVRLRYAMATGVSLEALQTNPTASTSARACGTLDRCVVRLAHAGHLHALWQR